jgi:hypothetical protein
MAARHGAESSQKVIRWFILLHPVSINPLQALVIQLFCMSHSSGWGLADIAMDLYNRSMMIVVNLAVVLVDRILDLFGLVKCLVGRSSRHSKHISIVFSTTRASLVMKK